MTTNRWSVTKALVWGAIIGVVYGVGKLMIDHPGAPTEYYTRGVIGGALGGALLFSAVVAIRNAFAPKR
jgi:hypothetical protein